MHLMFIGALFTHPQEESTWNKNIFSSRFWRENPLSRNRFPRSHYDVAVTASADNVLLPAIVACALFGRPSTRSGCCICVTVRLPVRPRRDNVLASECEYPPFRYPLLHVPDYLQRRTFARSYVWPIGRTPRGSCNRALLRRVLKSRLVRASIETKVLRRVLRREGVL